MSYCVMTPGDFDCEITCASMGTACCKVQQQQQEELFLLIPFANRPLDNDPANDQLLSGFFGDQSSSDWLNNNGQFSSPLDLDWPTDSFGSLPDLDLNPPTDSFGDSLTDPFNDWTEL